MSCSGSIEEPVDDPDQLFECLTSTGITDHSSVLSTEGQIEYAGIEKLNFRNMDEEMKDANAPGEEEVVENDDEDGDEDEEEVENSSVVLENIVEAKSMLILSPKVYKRALKKQSPAWEYFYTAKLREGITLKELKEKDSDAHQLLLESEKCGLYYICKPCYDKETTKLCHCFKKTSDNGPNNLAKHLKHCHGPEWDEYLEKCDKLGISIKENKQKKRNADAVLASSLASTTGRSPSVVSKKKKGGRSPQMDQFLEVSPASSVTFPSSPPVNIPHDHTAFTCNQQRGTESLVEDFHYLLHKCTTNNNWSVRSTTDKQACPEFFELLKFAMKNGQQIMNHPNLIMGKRQFNNYRKDMFNTLLGAVDMYVSEVRKFYKTELKRDTDFLIVGHDVWDSKQIESLGVTVHFYSPVRQVFFKIPIGLESVDDKRATQTAEQCEDLLSACGIWKEDLYKAVNDTTNTALKVGRLLAGQNGSCSMHEVQLALDHAVGKKTRKRNNKIVDSFKEAEAIRLQALKASGYLMEKKAKARFKKYKELMVEKGRVGQRIAQPNSTRAAGINIFYESIIRQRFNLHVYWFKMKDSMKDKNGKPLNVTLTDDEFWQLAQFAGILYPIGLLIKLVQTDTPGAIAYTHFFVFRTFYTYLCTESFYVPETKIAEHEAEGQTKWNGDARFPKRDFLGIPQEPYTMGSMIQLVEVKKDDLTDISKKMVKRLVKELKQYGAEPNDNRLLAMACNPFTAVHCMLELQVLSQVMGEFANDDNFVKSKIEGMDFDFKKRAVAALVTEIKLLCSEILPKEGEGEVEQGPQQQRPSSPTDIRAKYRKKILEESKVETNADVTDPVEKQVLDFFSQNFNPLNHITDQKVRDQIGGSSESWVARCELIAKHFDVFKWWESIGKSQFPWIYLVACRILSLPDSNGDQERTFSAATWMDGKLSTRQSDLTFGMKVLLYKNQDFLHAHRKDVQRGRKIAAEQRTKQILDKHFKKKNDDDIGDDDEGVWEAYGSDED